MDDTDALSPQSAPTLQPVKPLQPEAVDNTRDLFVCSSLLMSWVWGIGVLIV